MEDKPNRRAAEAPKSDLAKGTSIALKGVLEALPGGGILHDLLQTRAEALKAAFNKKNEERLRVFYADLLHGKEFVDDSVANAMVDDADFQTLLRACLTDIEAEKTAAYAALARAIATGRLEKNWRRHFILALRDMSATELSSLQKALVARNHPLVPSNGPSMDESTFLKPGAPGSLQSIVIQNLISKGFVHEEKLSSAGVKFIQACLSERDLTPTAIGYKAWTSHNVAVLSYQISDAAMDTLAIAICDELRRHYIKSSIFAVTRKNPMARMMFTHGILLVGDKSDGLTQNVDHLNHFCRRLPLFVVNVKLPSAVLPNDLHPGQSFNAVGRDVQEVANELRGVILQETTLPKA